MNVDGTVSESADEPTCAVDGCDQSVIPGTSHCGEHSTAWPGGNGPNGGPDGSLSDGTNPGADPAGGYQDGTLREDVMTPEEIRLAAYLVAVRATYTEKELEALGKKGHAFKNPDGSYSFPIANKDDLENAIHAVGRSGSSHDAVRKYIIGRAKELGAEDSIPDNWAADGSIKDQKSEAVETETRDEAEPTEVESVEEPVEESVNTEVETEAEAEETEEAEDETRDSDEDAEARKADRLARKPRHRSTPAPTQEIRDSVTHFGINDLKVTEVRVGSGSDGTLTLSGTPIVYNRSYTVHDMWGAFRETMAPTVCDGVLASKFHLDCRFLFNHDGMPLARTQSGTLELINTRDGLQCVATLDARMTLANDLAIAIERGDVSQMSCGFIVGDDEWNDDMDQRTIHRFSELLDVSPVTYPASPTTHIAVAQRMMASQPLESRARIREACKLMNEIRAGRTLNKHNAQVISSVLESLHTADELDPEEFGSRAAALAAAHQQASAALRNIEGLELEPEADNSDSANGDQVITDPGESIRSEDEQKTLRQAAIKAQRDRLARRRGVL